jgi:hypothetical protein
MCGNPRCKSINIFYLCDDEKIFIHYDKYYKPIWIQHIDKFDKERTFLRDTDKIFKSEYLELPIDNQLLRFNT